MNGKISKLLPFLLRGILLKMFAVVLLLSAHINSQPICDTRGIRELQELQEIHEKYEGNTREKVISIKLLE